MTIERYLVRQLARRARAALVWIIVVLSAGLWLAGIVHNWRTCHKMEWCGF